MEIKNSDVATLIKALQDPRTGLNWLALEILGLIQEGKTSQKSYLEPGQKRRKSGQTTEPYTETEEMGVALAVLDSRIVAPMDYWEKALELADEATKKPTTPTGGIGVIPRRPRVPIKLSLIDDLRESQEFVPDEHEAKVIVMRLKELLAEARSEPQ